MVVSAGADPRVRAAFAVDRPLLWVLLLYACGIAIRAIYTFQAHPPEAFIVSDMSFYVTLAKRLASTAGPLNPWDVTHRSAIRCCCHS